MNGHFNATNDLKDAKRILLENLAHHKKQPQEDGTVVESINTYWKPQGDGTAAPSSKLIDILRNFNNKRLKEDLEPLDPPTAEEIATRHNNADSDTESVDNSYDLFRNASVYTEEEILRTLRDKMIRLRRLYIEQYSHIQYLLKEKRLKFIQAQRTEDEMFGDIYSFRNYPDNPDYPKLRAMLKYHKAFGPDSLLQNEAKKRRQERPQNVGPHNQPHGHPCNDQANDSTIATTNSTAVVNQATNICIFSKTSYACDKPSVPLSPYCKQHILYDNKQVLFRPCAGGMPPCLTPVVSYTRKNKCWLHTEIN